MPDEKKFFVFIGGRDYHPDGPHFSPKLGQPYIVVTLHCYNGSWYASGEVRFDVPNDEIRPDVISSSNTNLEEDLKGLLGRKIRIEDFGLVTRRIYSVVVNLLIESAQKLQEKEITTTVS